LELGPCAIGHFHVDVRGGSSTLDKSIHDPRAAMKKFSDRRRDWYGTHSVDMALPLQDFALLCLHEVLEEDEEEGGDIRTGIYSLLGQFTRKNTEIRI
jgi:hypothetical protein